MRRTHELWGPAAWVAAIVLLFGTGVAVTGFFGRLDELAGRLRRTQDVIRHVQEALGDVLELRTAQRAYRSTGNLAYLTEYEQAVTGLRDSYALAAALSADNPSQLKRVDRLQELANELIAYADGALERGRERSFVSALPHGPAARSERDRERETVRDLVALTRETTQEETVLLGTRRERVRAARATLGALVLAALAIAFVLVAVASFSTAAARARRRRAQVREEHVRFQEGFIGILGHDLRNPLSAILVSAELLGHRALAEPDAKAVARIRSSSQRMTRMIHQLLDLTRTRSGGIPVQPRPVDLAELAHRVVDELEIAHPEQRMALAVETAATGGEWDADRLAQVISNLVGNAIDHGRGEPIEVRIGDDGARATLSVHNQGEPIPAALLPAIFEPFRRGDHARPSGLGLGLYITRQIVIAHGGEIEVESSADTGTTFRVRLPRAASRAA
jgi:signal transduction histidine kinase